MPSTFTHAVAAVALGRAYTNRRLPARFWILSVFCAAAPDLDVICTRFGIDYSHMLGHRGLTHSFLFAIVLSAIIVALFFRKPIEGVSRKSLFAYFFVATISHAMLDGMVNGTLGVALLAPFNAERFFLPLRPIVSSPVGWDFFSASGVAVLKNEFVWLWAPSLLIIFAPWIRKRFANRRNSEDRAPNLDCRTPESPALQHESLP